MASKNGSLLPVNNNKNSYGYVTNSHYYVLS